MRYFHACVNHHFIMVITIYISINMYNSPHFSSGKFNIISLVICTFYPYINSYPISSQSHINQYISQSTSLSIHIYIHIYIYIYINHHVHYLFHHVSHSLSVNTYNDRFYSPLKAKQIMHPKLLFLITIQLSHDPIIYNAKISL